MSKSEIFVSRYHALMILAKISKEMPFAKGFYEIDLLLE